MSLAYGHVPLICNREKNCGSCNQCNIKYKLCETSCGCCAATVEKICTEKKKENCVKKYYNPTLAFRSKTGICPLGWYAGANNMCYPAQENVGMFYSC